MSDRLRAFRQRADEAAHEPDERHGPGRERDEEEGAWEDEEKWQVGDGRERRSFLSAAASSIRFDLHQNVACTALPCKRPPENAGETRSRPSSMLRDT
jgi:hypothetical protein